MHEAVLGSVYRGGASVRRASNLIIFFPASANRSLQRSGVEEVSEIDSRGDNPRYNKQHGSLEGENDEQVDCPYFNHKISNSPRPEASRCFAHCGDMTRTQ